MTDRTLMPTDDSLVSVLARLSEAGWTVDHRLRPEATIECGRCGSHWAASDTPAEVQHRVEGTSDPDDLQLVVGLRCPTCAATGRVTTSYGPGLRDDERDFLDAVDLDDASSPLADAPTADRTGATGAAAPSDVATPRVLVVTSIDDRVPADAWAGLRDLLPPTTAWSILGLLPPHPATATGATGFASPVLTLEQVEARAEHDEQAGAEATRAVAASMDDPGVEQRLLRSDQMHELLAMLERERTDVVVTTSTSDSFWSFLTREPTEELLDEAPCPVLVLPEFDADADEPRERMPSSRRDGVTAVVAVDDTALDHRLLEQTTTLLDRASDDLDVVIAHVAPAQAAVRSIPLATGIAPATDGQMVGEALQRLDDDGDAARDVAEQTAADAGLDDATAVGTVGPIVSGILGVAEDHDADLIVVGTHDRSWFSRLLEPSVSAGVEARARRPVLVVS